MTALTIARPPAFAHRAGLRARIDEERAARPPAPPPDPEPVSPELVLVSPPEVARLAREALPDLALAVPARAAPQSAARAPRRVPVATAAFWALCVGNAVTPLALAIAALS
jgi:hypothetical protein